MNTHSFTAIDFETAQGPRWSICQVGLVRMVDGEVADSLSILIQPPDNYYLWSFTGIHGISSRDTVSAPTFDQVWPRIRPFIEGELLVAHNASFDMSCLRKALDYYGLAHPEFTPACTYKIYRKGLARLCAEEAIPLNHHDALSDARACAELYLRHLRGQGRQSPDARGESVTRL